MPDTPLRFDHLAIPVYDAPRTLQFYTEVLQLPLVDAISGDDWGGKPWLRMFFGTGGGQAQRVQRWIAAQCGSGAAGRE
jgi:catechol 2,3-dioxygenase-like lactoylglutathione lyase family enzyme